MSIQSELMGAVHSAVLSALSAAEKNWKQTPALANAAALTSRSVRTSCDQSEGELGFETHRQNIPASRRDLYGVAGRTHAARTAGVHSPKADPQTLMRKTEEVLLSSFVDALDRHL